MVLRMDLGDLLLAEVSRLLSQQPGINYYEKKLKKRIQKRKFQIL
jgi:hypothetical protein